MKFHFVGAAVAFMALAVITFEVAEAMEVFNDAPTVAEDNYAEVENVDEEDNDDFLDNDVHLFDTKGQSVRFKEATYEEFNIICYTDLEPTPCLLCIFCISKISCRFHFLLSLLYFRTYDEY